QVSIDANIMSQLIIGSLYPNNPLANLEFLSYSVSTLLTSIGFISEFKFAHYMKIPPKSLFLIQ
ncbi:hypothetical protein MKW94_015261, partial [Papaver nudicaule]|nr:hypothetical protein [Papaver nudicaule]